MVPGVGFDVNTQIALSRLERGLGPEHQKLSRVQSEPGQWIGRALGGASAVLECKGGIELASMSECSKIPQHQHSHQQNKLVLGHFGALTHWVCTRRGLTPLLTP